MDRQSTALDGLHVYCNGVKLASFRANITPMASNNIVIGDINSSSKIAPLTGDIGYFSMIKGTALSDEEIKTMHYALAKAFSITTQILDLS